MSFIEAFLDDSWECMGGRGSCCSWLVHASEPPPHVILVGLSGCPNHLRMGNFRVEGSAHLPHVAQYIWPNSTQGEPLSSYQLPRTARDVLSLLPEWIPWFNSSAPAGVPLPGGELNSVCCHAQHLLNWVCPEHSFSPQLPTVQCFSSSLPVNFS